MSISRVSFIYYLSFTLSCPCPLCTFCNGLVHSLQRPNLIYNISNEIFDIFSVCMSLYFIFSKTVSIFTFHFLTFIEWVWSWNHGGFVRSMFFLLSLKHT